MGKTQIASSIEDTRDQLAIDTAIAVRLLLEAIMSSNDPRRVQTVKDLTLAINDMVEISTEKWHNDY